MKIKILVVLVVLITNLSCTYILFTRHIEKTLDERLNFNQTGKISKTYYFSTTSVVNYLNEYIESKGTEITNLQINNVRLSVGLGNQNTASVLNNVEVSLNVGSSGNLKYFKINSIPLNFLVSITVNEYLDKKGVQELRKFLEENIVGKREKVFSLIIKADIPSGQRFTGDISIKMDVTMDAETCEKVFLGFEGARCL